MEGCLRLYGGKKTRKDAIPIEAIKCVVDEFSEDGDLKKLRFLVVCLIGFAGFFRIQELLDVKLKDVEILSDHMRLFLPSSKVDQHRDGENVFIART